HSMPPGAATCPRDGAELYQRPDDREEVIGKRLEVYEQQTRPLVAHYAKLGLLRIVAGEGALDDVFERMEAAALAKAVPATTVKVATRRAARRAASKPGAKTPKKTSAKSATKKSASARNQTRNQTRKRARK